MITYELVNLTDPELAEFDPDLVRYDDEFLSALVMKHNGVIVEIMGIDGGEPEDNYFFRDWSWVAPALNEAFQLGRDT